MNTLFRIAFAAIGILSGVGCFAQSGKITYGGDIGATFNNDNYIVQLSPIVGYKVTDQFIPGVGFVCDFSMNQSSQAWKLSFGPKAFAKYVIANGVYASAEYQLLNMDTKQNNMQDKFPNQSRYWHHTCLVGAGYQYVIPNVGTAYSEITYDLNQDGSPYKMPKLSVGIRR